MEAPSCRSPAKDPSRNLWRRKTNIFVAIPTLLSLYFIGAGIALTTTTRTFVAFHILSHSPQRFSPVELSLINSTYFTPAAAIPQKPTLEHLVDNLQAAPPAQSLRNNRNLNTSTTATSNATSSQRNPNPGANNNSIELATEPDFMKTPFPTKRNSQARAAILQLTLKQMTATTRRRWLHSNWSLFKILIDDNLSNQFNNRMQSFLCTKKNNQTNQTNHPQTDRHKADKASICKLAVPALYFCTERFFLTWMSPVASFSPRERIGIESIFKHHPEACVVILSRTLDSTEGRKLLAPFEIQNYRITALSPDLKSLFANTPAAKWLTQLRSGATDPGCINLMQNLSNLMRLVVLYKYGGVYVDTDVVLLRSFAEVRNAVGAQSKEGASGRWTRLNNAVLVFDRVHPVVRELVREFVATFDGSRWGWNGPYLVSRVVNKMQSNCSDLAVLPVQAFYPVNWIAIGRYFQAPSSKSDFKWQARELAWINRGTYSVHLWNKRSNHLTVQKGSIMETLLKRSCLFCKQGAAS